MHGASSLITLFIFYKQPPFWSTGYPISIFLWLLLSGCLILQRNSVWLLLMKNYQDRLLFTKTFDKSTHQTFENCSQLLITLQSKNYQNLRHHPYPIISLFKILLTYKSHTVFSCLLKFLQLLTN